MVSKRNPRVGYVQGHCDIVCFLLGNINTQEQDEEEASFWVYVSLIERYGLPIYQSDNAVGILTWPLQCLSKRLFRSVP